MMLPTKVIHQPVGGRYRLLHFRNEEIYLTYLKRPIFRPALVLSYNCVFIFRSKLDIFKFLSLAVVGSQVVAHRTTDREVPISIPNRSWGFSSLLFLFPISNITISGASYNRSLVEEQLY